MADSGVLGLITGQMIGRWGNFFNCEASAGIRITCLPCESGKAWMNPAHEYPGQLVDNEIVENGIAYIQVHPTFCMNPFGTWAC